MLPGGPHVAVDHRGLDLGMPRWITATWRRVVAQHSDEQ